MPDGDVEYTIIELSDQPPPRQVQVVASAMVASLEAKGWIARGSGRDRWDYRVTDAGIEAANGALVDP